MGSKLFKDNVNFLAGGKSVSSNLSKEFMYSYGYTPFLAKADFLLALLASFSRDAFKCCKLSINWNLPIVMDMYFSSVLAITAPHLFSLNLTAIGYEM